MNPLNSMSSNFTCKQPLLNLLYRCLISILGLSLLSLGGCQSPLPPEEDNPDPNGLPVKPETIEAQDKGNNNISIDHLNCDDLESGNTVVYEEVDESIEIYVVESGDSLSKISEKFYGSTGEWLRIYNANRDKSQDNGNIIVPGTEFIIPPLNADSVDSLSERDEPSGNESSPVRLVTADDYAPLTGFNLREGGMLTEVFKTAFTRAGYEPKVYFAPTWADAREDTKDGQFDATFPWIYTQERGTYLDYSDPVYRLEILLFKHQDYSFEYNGNQSLEGLSICRPKGYSLDDLQEMIDQGFINHVAPDKVSECFEELRDGNIDLVSISDAVGQDTIQNMKLEDQVEPIASTQSRCLHIAYPKGVQPQMVVQVNEALAAMKDDGTTERIRQKHLKY